MAVATARVIRGRAAPNLAARLGHETLRDRGGVAYRALKTRSLVNRCTSERMPFRWTVNPYRGCAMGCRYCYAAYTHEYLGLDAEARFHDTVYAKTGGAEETAKGLARAARRGELIALGTATDPYQPGEAQLRVTRRFLELATQVRGLRLSLTTKGSLVLRDLDLLAQLHARARLTVQVSLVSPDAALLRRLEPWAPPPEVRFEVLRRLAEAGLDVGLALAPILPGLTDGEADLEQLFASAHAAGVRRLGVNVLFLRSPTREKFLAWLAGEFPRLAETYERAYARGAYVGGRYRAHLDARLERLRLRYGFDSLRELDEAPARPARQLELFQVRVPPSFSVAP